MWRLDGGRWEEGKARKPRGKWILLVAWTRVAAVVVLWVVKFKTLYFMDLETPLIVRYTMAI